MPLRRFRRGRKRRFRKRKFGRRKRLGFKRGVLRALHNRPKPELKWNQQTHNRTNWSAATPATMVLTNPIDTGDLPSDRVGNTITIKKVICMFRIYSTNSAVFNQNNNTLLRMTLFRFKEYVNPAALPNYANLMTTTTGSNLAFIRPRNYSDVNNPQATSRVIWDKMMTVKPMTIATVGAPAGSTAVTRFNGTDAYFKKIWRFKNLRVQWNGAVGNDPHKGALVLYCNISDTNYVTIDLNTMIRFTDS